MIFKVLYKPARAYAGHVMCRVFVSPGPNRTWANLGVLIVRVDEFEALRAAMSGFTFEPEYSEREQNG